MNESQYFQKIEAAFRWIDTISETWADQHDLDLETHRNGSVLELECPNGQKIITNAQAPTQQLWLASAKGAHHFVFQDGRWEDTRGHGEFSQVFLDHAQTALGMTLEAPAAFQP